MLKILFRFGGFKGAQKIFPLQDKLSQLSLGVINYILNLCSIQFNLFNPLCHMCDNGHVKIRLQSISRL
jgi:hypothetical protein